MMTRAMSATMRPYSTAVAPRSEPCPLLTGGFTASSSRTSDTDAGSDRAGNGVEQVAQVGTEEGDRGDDDDGDEGDHEAVLNRGGALLVAEAGLELDECLGHDQVLSRGFGPVFRFGRSLTTRDLSGHRLHSPKVDAEKSIPEAPNGRSRHGPFGRCTNRCRSGWPR